MSKPVDDKLILDAFKLIMPRIIEMLISVSENDDERALMRGIMTETLALAASLHLDAGGTEAGFVLRAQELVQLAQSDGATKQ